MQTNLPPSPVLGQILTLANGVQYTFDGQKWRRSDLTLTLSMLDDVDVSALSFQNVLRWNGTKWVAASPSPIYNVSSAVATGGDVVWTDGTFQYHEFTTAGSMQSINFTQIRIGQILIVGGGGGGGAGMGGGGGAGAVILTEPSSFPLGTSTVYVGQGGVGGTISSGTSVTAASAGEASWYRLLNIAPGVIAEGGGYGGHGINTFPVSPEPTAGGSGGGSGAFQLGKTNSGAAGYSSFGMAFRGGNANPTGEGGGGGGGGAGGSGQSAFTAGGNVHANGQGGPGINAWGYMVGGGGAGGVSSTGVYRMQSGAVAFGGGSTLLNATAMSGQDGTGGGGGGGSISGSPIGYNGGNGGSGIVVFRYRV